MNYEYGLMINKTEFIKIGDVIDTIFRDGTHYDGRLDELRYEDEDLVVEGMVFNMKDIKSIIKL